MNFARLFKAATIAASLASFTHTAFAGTTPSEAAIKELSPTGTLRVAVAIGASPTAFRAVRDPATGTPRGVTVDLATALAQKLGVQLQLVPFGNSGAIADAAAAGAWDVAFLPADVDRARRLDFSPPYVLFESSFLVRQGAGIRGIDQVDRAGVRVGALARSTTIQTASRSLRKATVVPFGSEPELLAALRASKVDAAAMGRESLEALAAKLPGSRILEGSYHSLGVAAAVRKDRPEALAYLGEFIEEQKATGALRQSLDAAGVRAGVIAPAVSGK